MAAFDLALGIFGGDDGQDHVVKRKEQKLFQNWEFVHRERVAEESPIFEKAKKEREAKEAAEKAAKDGDKKEEKKDD